MNNLKVFITIVISSLLAICNLNAQTREALRSVAASFPKMPTSATQLAPFKKETTPIVVTAGSPTNDLEWTVFDSDYVDGETNGYDIYCPIDPSEQYPGSDKVRMIETVSKLNTDSLYGGAKGDRIILGVAEIPYPFFHRGLDGIDNDYMVIRHFDFRQGHIQLRGGPADYSLIYFDTVNDGVKTGGWYLFYTADGGIDLIAFIHACDDITQDNQTEFGQTFCNKDKNLRLDDPKQFRYAMAINATPSIPEGLAQIGGNGKEVISGSTVDFSGNVYLFGLTDSQFDYGSKVANKVFVSKTTPTGELAWIAQMESVDGTLIFDAVTDSQYVYAAGRTYGSLPGFTNKGRWDGIILKIDIATGTIVKHVQFGTAIIDGFGNITIDDNQNLYVSGAGAPLGTTSPGDNSFLIAKYRCSDLQQVWLVTEPVLSTATKAAEAWGGISYHPGNYPGGGKLLTGGWFASGGMGGADGFLVLYNGLDKSYPTRENTFVVNSPGFKADWVWGSTFDKNGNVYAVGYTTGNLGGTQKGEGDAFVLKLAPNLTNPVYRQVGTNKSERFRKIKVDGDGNIFVSGYTYGDLERQNPDRKFLTADIVVQKYAANLELLKSIQFGTPHEERGFLSLTNNRVYVGGMTEGSIKSANLGSFDGFVLALNKSDLSYNNNPVLSVINSEFKEQIKFYPNPTNDFIRFEMNGLKNCNFSVSNHLGQQLKTGKLDNTENTVSLSEFKNGIYFINLTDKHSNRTIKIIKH